MSKNMLLAIFTLCILGCISTPRPINYTSLVTGIIHTETGSGTCFPIALVKSAKTNKNLNNGVKLQLITASHVVFSHNQVEVNAAGVATEKRIYKADRIELFRQHVKIYESSRVVVLRVNKEIDIALVEISLPLDIKVVMCRLSKISPVVGQRVLSVGSRVGLIPTFAEGLVCRKEFDYLRGAWITSAPVWHGVSGGPVIAMSTGETIGVTLALYYGGGTPISHVHIFMDAVMIHKWLGQKFLKNRSL